MNDDSGTLKTLVAHALEKPLLRLDGFKEQHLKVINDNKLQNLTPWKGVKTGAKKFGPRWSRQVHNARHFVITDELMEIVAPMVLKGTHRQFENAFQNARIPFNSVFIEWNREHFDEIADKYHRDNKYDEVFNSKEPILFASTSKPTIKTRISMQGFWCSHARLKPVADKFDEYGRTHRWNQIADLSESDNHSKYNTMFIPFVSDPDNKVMTRHYAYESDIFCGAEGRGYGGTGMYANRSDKHQSRSTGLVLCGIYGYEKLVMHEKRKIQQREFLPEFSTNTKENYLIATKNPLFFRAAENEEDVFYDDFLQDEVISFRGCHELGLLTAFLALLNEPWTTKEATKLRGTNSINTNMTPFDSYYKVKVNLPREKATRAAAQAFKRVAPFGKRQHDVMGHKRQYRNEFGEVYKTVYIKAHKRGDPKLGIITKDYVLDARGA